MAALFLVYSKYQDPEFITPGAVDSFLRMAYGFYVGMLASMASVAYGLHKYHSAAAAGGRGMLSVIALATSGRKPRKVFVATFVAYGIFFSLTSGTLVYQPEIIFSFHYGVDVPSAEIIPCCDAPGFMPKIHVYITENVGLQVIPLNLALQVAVSYLVAVNISLAAGAYAAAKRGAGVGGIGAVTGLFVACPTCVGSLLSAFVGTASGIALAATLAQFQTVFIAVSIPVLLVGPVIMARKLQGGDCALDLAVNH
ncbi:conserved hypothetical protein [Cenarchaeum symbiosum A]|uniref:Uncharacterized protein n=1 Tax=Cenarchaeum symbiosum (strain A) TaxID=414004 RepID=A0RW25_CENSY|nr:conserved hypothetical protein [Cenarchaeum symbiosum A]